VSTYREDFRLEDGILYVRLSGKFPNDLLNEAPNLFQPLIDACSTYKCDKALIDATDLEVNLSTMEVFRAGDDTGSLARLHILVAILAREDMINYLFEVVAINRGANVRVFTNVDAARTWLQS